MVFCNFIKMLKKFKGHRVTILILIDGFLQSKEKKESLYSLKSHNPYFNRWFSAIQTQKQANQLLIVTILILIDGFLQFNYAC